jgi:phospholipase/carboxylesterase
MRDPGVADLPLETVEVEPDGGPAEAAVLWMHGLGADGHDFEGIVPYLALPGGPRIRFVFPHAPVIPVTLNMGMRMRAWYDLVGNELPRLRHDEAGIRSSARAIEALLRREKDRGVPAERIAVAGFSQGGAMALHVGLRHGERLAGIVALSSFLVLPDALPAEASAENRGTPVLWCHGTDDPMVPEPMGRIGRDRLLALGWDVTWRTWPMQHEVCLEEIREVAQFLRRRLASPAPGTRP